MLQKYPNYWFLLCSVLKNSAAWTHPNIATRKEGY
jgi:hypothetical protein